jgi:hypothetical protein
MIDYLSRVAQQAANPSTDVRPSWRPLFGDRHAETMDSPFDASPGSDEFANVESPGSWREASELRTVPEIGHVAMDFPDVSSDHEQLVHVPMRERVIKGDRPAEVVPANILDQTTEMRHSASPTRQQSEVTARGLLAAESQEAPQPDMPSVADDQRPETRSANTPSNIALSRREHPTSAAPGTQDRRRPPHGPNEDTLDRQLQGKPASADQQPMSNVMLDSVVEIHFQRASALRPLRPQVTDRSKEIIPLSATAPAPALSMRSQPVSSPVTQPAAETIVHVTIGRVEVRATVGQQKPMAAREPVSRHASQSLEDYLRGGSSGRSS